MGVELPRVRRLPLIPYRIQRSFGRVFFFVPYRTKVYVSARIFTFECYVPELLGWTIGGAHTLFTLVLVGRAGLKMSAEEFLFGNEEDEGLDFYAPMSAPWARWAYRLIMNVKGKVEETKGEITVAPLFTPTPEEELKRYPPRRHFDRLARGNVRLLYFRSLEKGKYQPGQEAKPDDWGDLPVDANGVDLARARHWWSMESIAAITDKGGSSGIFHPVDQDRLSPLAAYNLSKQWTQPIRIFEPRTSKVTPTARKIRNIIYPILFFIWTFLRLLVGFPEHNVKFLGNLYGTAYASVYDYIGWVTEKIRLGTFDAIQIIFSLPFALTIVLWFGIKIAAVWFASAVGGALSSAADLSASAICCVFDLAMYLDWKAWLFFLGVFWYAIAEYRSPKA